MLLDSSGSQTGERVLWSAEGGTNLKQGERRIREKDSASRNTKVWSASGGICCMKLHGAQAHVSLLDCDRQRESHGAALCADEEPERAARDGNIPLATSPPSGP